MSPPPRVSDAEWEVMRLLWESSPQSASELIDRLRGRRDWTDRTIKTLLSRLVRKGALDYAVDGPRYLYSPRVSREDCVRQESTSFLERVFDGSPSPLLAHLVDEGQLNEADLDTLRRLIDERDAEKDSRP